MGLRPHHPLRTVQGTSSTLVSKISLFYSNLKSNFDVLKCFIKLKINLILRIKFSNLKKSNRNSCWDLPYSTVRSKDLVDLVQRIAVHTVFKCLGRNLLMSTGNIFPLFYLPVFLFFPSVCIYRCFLVSLFLLNLQIYIIR